MQEEPDFLDKVVDARLPPGAPDIHHPLMGRLVIFFPLIWGNVPDERARDEEEKTARGIEELAQVNIIDH